MQTIRVHRFSSAKAKHTITAQYQMHGTRNTWDVAKL